MRNKLAAPVAILGGIGIAMGSPRVEQGVLSAPLRGTTDERARAYLAGRPDLADGTLVLERQRGERVRYRRHHRGVPILGGVVTVRLDAEGRVRWVASDGGQVPADLSVEPALGAAEAARVASRGRYDDDRMARLFVWAPPGRDARLVWEVKGVPEGPRKLWRVLVDANTGQMLLRENLVRTDRRGTVFTAGNPVTGGLTEVTLDLPEGSTHLENADFLARNCIDRMTCPVVEGTSNFRACEIEAKATADGTGDFFYARPDVDTAPEDEFSEVQMFFHADRVLQKFRDLGFVDLGQTPMEVVVNYREPAAAQQACTGTTSTAPLQAFENAFFTPGSVYHGWPAAPTVVFGQGAAVDYAYDGDVVYHEFTHAVQDVIWTLSFAAFDELGLDGAGGAMVEGTADYFSSAITGDPKLGEYAGGEHGFIRDIGGNKTCPDDLTGELHDDSEPFSSGLWSARIALAEGDRATFDRAVFNAMDSFGDVESFSTATTKIAAETEVLLGPGAAATVRQKLADRGLDGCNQRVIEMAPGDKKSFLWLLGWEIVGEQIGIPAPYQFKVTLTRPAQTLFLQVDRRGVDGNMGPLNVITKAGAVPVQWNPNNLTHDGSAGTPWDVLVDGNKTLMIPGPFEAGPLIVQLSNVAEGTVVLLDLSIYTDAEGAPAPDAGPAAMGDDGGCCQVGGASRLPGVLLLGALTALVLRRRRARR